MALRLEPLAPGRADAFRDLLGGEEFGGCFCAVWTAHDPATWAARCADPARPNLARTLRDVRGGRRAGYLVHDGGRLVGWTGAGPKPEFPLLATKLGSRLSPSEPTTWSVGCIALRAEVRGRRLADDVVRAVIDEARRADARVVEAYPVRPYHEPRVYRGTAAMYERLGFAEAGAERDGDFDVLLVRYALRSSPGAAAP